MPADCDFRFGVLRIDRKVCQYGIHPDIAHTPVEAGWAAAPDPNTLLITDARRRVALERGPFVYGPF